jgi:hypothetical protein
VHIQAFKPMHSTNRCTERGVGALSLLRGPRHEHCVQTPLQQLSPALEIPTSSSSLRNVFLGQCRGIVCRSLCSSCLQQLSPAPNIPAAASSLQNVLLGQCKTAFGHHSLCLLLSQCKTATQHAQRAQCTTLHIVGKYSVCVCVCHMSQRPLTCAQS